MDKPKERIRLTMADELPACPGVYIIAYLGRIVYVGITTGAVCERMEHHITNALQERLGAWLLKVDDWPNIRIDVLVPPDTNVSYWLYTVEAACIKQFNPLFNEQL